MEIQNISGSDVVSSGFNVNSRITSENITNEKEEVREEIKPTEKEKGNIIDTKAWFKLIFKYLKRPLRSVHYTLRSVYYTLRSVHYISIDRQNFLWYCHYVF